MKLPFINFSIDMSQNLTPEPCLTKTLSDIIKSQLQQSLNQKVSIETPQRYVGHRELGSRRLGAKKSLCLWALGLPTP